MVLPYSFVNNHYDSFSFPLPHSHPVTPSNLNKSHPYLKVIQSAQQRLPIHSLQTNYSCVPPAAAFIRFRFIPTPSLLPPPLIIFNFSSIVPWGLCWSSSSPSTAAAALREFLAEGATQLPPQPKFSSRQKPAAITNAPHNRAVIVPSTTSVAAQSPLLSSTFPSIPPSQHQQSEVQAGNTPHTQKSGFSC
jgi:hypothetical protein